MKLKGVLGAVVGVGAWLFAPVPIFAQDDVSPSGVEPSTAEPASPEPTDTTAAPETVTPVDPVGPNITVQPAPVVVVDDDDLEVTQAGFVPRSGYGVAISLGGGVTDFVSDAARDVTGVGGAWDLRLTLGTRSILGFEASYVGGAHDLAALGLDDDAYLLRNGAEGALRVNAPIARGNWLVAPYAFGGAGWTRFDVMNSDFNTSALQSDDNIITVPVGAGIGAAYRGFMFDSRFTYRAAFEDDLLGNADLHTWGVTANIGREF